MGLCGLLGILRQAAGIHFASILWAQIMGLKIRGALVEDLKRLHFVALSNLLERLGLHMVFLVISGLF